MYFNGATARGFLFSFFFLTLALAINLLVQQEDIVMRVPVKRPPKRLSVGNMAVYFTWAQVG